MINPDVLTAKKEACVSVILHKVLNLIGKSGPVKYLCFFEGIEDIPYYCCFLRSKYDQYEPFCCNGKDNVIEMYLLLSKKQLRNCKSAYFVDHDFDAHVLYKEIFETNCYSIENYYTNQVFIGNVLKHEFRLISSDQEFISCMNFFMEKQEEFHDSIILFNAWYFNFKNNIKGNKNELGVVLGKNINTEFINWNFDLHISSNYNLDVLYALFPKVTRNNDNEINKILDFFNKQDLSQVLRGKYEIEFIQRFIRYLIDDANQKNKRKYIKKKTSVNFQEDRFISTFCQYATKPLGLDEYIDLRFNS